MSKNHSDWGILRGTQSRHSLFKDYLIVGRDPEYSDIILLSQSISKRQCVIERNTDDKGNIYTLTDLNSRNGTFVNKNR